MVITLMMTCTGSPSLSVNDLLHDIHKKIKVFDLPFPCPHETDPVWTSTCCQHEIHITLSKQLVQ